MSARLGVAFVLVMATVCQASEVIRHPATPDTGDVRNAYFLELLKLALTESEDDYGPWTLVPSPQPVSQSRALALLAAGDGLDVLWTMTSNDREEQLRPIRIPLLKGLMGYRLLLVRESDLTRFSAISSLAQLRALTAGQGHDWPDTRILRANGINVTTSNDYDGLFRMLEAGRFDFLPRALNEPFSEIASHAGRGLAVEPSLILHYPTANYFFVAADDTALAERLETGLRRALASGRFDELFRNHPVNADAFRQANILGRRVIRLHNPLLPEQTPLEEGALWWPPAMRPADTLNVPDAATTPGVAE